ncbi:hypothetical protein BJX64DRAFT_250954 [Aspergillus heterothallicus]
MVPTQTATVSWRGDCVNLGFNTFQIAGLNSVPRVLIVLHLGCGGWFCGFWWLSQSAWKGLKTEMAETHMVDLLRISVSVFRNHVT